MAFEQVSRIHFLNTGASDCILLESNGHFALIDAAEDNDYPANKPNLKFKGFEDEVVAYLLEHAADENGIVTLDFVLGTHAHSDHIGGFDTVLSHPKIRAKKAYLRPYNAKCINRLETTLWDNQEVYDQMCAALREKQIPIIEHFNGETSRLGDFSLTFFYFEHKGFPFPVGENENSVVTLAEKDGVRILLVGDLNNKRSDERRLSEKVGKVDLLKVGHHGYTYSSSVGFLKRLSPKAAIIPNFKKNAHIQVVKRLSRIIKDDILYTADENGILVTVQNNGTFSIHKNLDTAF